ncbi:hypothetical protein CEXT_800711 [Caerostris extrusa]|uniref:Uncharacterized protein n=1 Tax=Caerostris extrusa TaxID=172846 RepID=A0AAV4TML3_CAEEX|nr:hypothetical protein CEXT_800711 [Caerostris extrusa]
MTTHTKSNVILRQENVREPKSLPGLLVRWGWGARNEGSPPPRGVPWATPWPKDKAAERLPMRCTDQYVTEGKRYKGLLLIDFSMGNKQQRLSGKFRTQCHRNSKSANYRKGPKQEKGGFSAKRSKLCSFLPYNHFDAKLEIAKRR